MANWWDNAPVVQAQQQPANWWESAQVVSPAWEQEEAQANLRALGGTVPRAPDPNDKSYTGSLLPISYDKDGNWSFDSNAGIVGAIKAAVTAPGRAMSGDLQVMGPDGHVTQEAIGEGLNFAGVTSPINPGIRSGDYVIPGVRGSFKEPEVKPPSAAQLQAAAKEGYEDLRNMGVDYKTGAINGLSSEIQAGLTSDGIIPDLAPKTYSVLARLGENPEGSVASLDGLTAARRAFGHAAADIGNPTEQLAAKRAMEALDGFISRSDPATVERGPASEVPSVLADARGNYAAYKRSQTLTDLDEAAQLRAAAANSGQNAGNTTRQRIASLILNGKKSAGFGEEDLNGLEGVVKGSLAANATRAVGNVLGGGGGLGATLTGGAGSIPGLWMGSPEFAAAGAVALPAIGRGAKEISNALTERALAAVERDTRKRSPLYEEMVKNAGKVPDVPEKTLALARAIMLGAVPYPQNGGGGW